MLRYSPVGLLIALAVILLVLKLAVWGGIAGLLAVIVLLVLLF